MHWIYAVYDREANRRAVEKVQTLAAIKSLLQAAFGHLQLLDLIIRDKAARENLRLQETKLWNMPNTDTPVF